MVPAGFAPPDLYEQRFQVEFDYPVAFVEGAFEAAAPTLAWAIARREPARRHPTFVAVDSGLAAARPELSAAISAYVARYSDVLELRGEPLIVAGGESCKNDPAQIPTLLEHFARARLDRQAVVLAVGGGAMLDAVGYAASVTHRGLRLVRMPSTVLAQCDGGVGVKTSVNGFAAKNFLGTFAPPHAVVDDFALLRTLPLRDARAGMAEAVKVALIRDPDFFAWLEANADALSRAEPGPLATLVRRCAALHLAHIARGGDPFETGSARPLDYGHWAAHKLEILSAHELRHGEAVAIGMLLDARYAERTGLLATSELDRIVSLLARLGLPLHHPALESTSGGRLAVLRGLEDFREHLGGALSVTLLAGIGRGQEAHAIDSAVVEQAIGWLSERARAA